MKKILIIIFFFLSTLYAQDDTLDSALKSIMGQKNYSVNKQLLSVVFKHKESFYDGRDINYLSLIKALQENRLVDFSQNSNQNYSFSANGAPLLFVKIITDSFRDMAIMKFNIMESHLNSSEFELNLAIGNESKLDPVVFANELSKYGCKIVKLDKGNNGGWNYNIDMSNAQLNLSVMSALGSVKMQRVESEKWLDVSNIATILINSNLANNWYPFISFYDRDLKLIKVQKNDEKTEKIVVLVPQNCVYMKITDIYSLKNMKNGLTIEVNSAR